MVKRNSLYNVPLFSFQSVILLMFATIFLCIDFYLNLLNSYATVSSTLLPSPNELISLSSCEETSEAASSILKFEISPPREEVLSSSPLIDVAGDTSAGDGDASESSTGCCRLQNIMLAVRVRSIFWFTCHKITHHMNPILYLTDNCYYPWQWSALTDFCVCLREKKKDLWPSPILHKWLFPIQESHNASELNWFFPPILWLSFSQII